jgi:hypothetical protein
VCATGPPIPGTPLDASHGLSTVRGAALVNPLVSTNRRTPNSAKYCKQSVQLPHQTIKCKLTAGNKKWLISHRCHFDEAAALDWLGKSARQPNATTARQLAPESMTKGGPVTRCGNVIPIADGVPKASIDVAAHVAWIVLASAAAFFSIKGWWRCSQAGRWPWS